MWYPPSTHQQGYIQGRQQITHFPSHDQGQSQIFSMAPPEPRPITQDVGFQMPHTPCDPRVQSRRMGIQGVLEPFDLQNHGGGQGAGNQVVVANNKVNHQHGQPQP
eukprot:5453182-Amphidinium_carterae.1